MPRNRLCGVNWLGEDGPQYPQTLLRLPPGLRQLLSPNVMTPHAAMPGTGDITVVPPSGGSNT